MRQVEKMEITGKALKDFWKWYLLPEQRKRYKTGSLLGKEPAIKIRFLAMSFTERYGVYVDFFREVLTSVDYLNMLEFIYQHQKFSTDTLNKARQHAIEKANEIYNQK